MSELPPRPPASRPTLHPAIRIGLYLPALVAAMIVSAWIVGALLSLVGLDLRRMPGLTPGAEPEANGALVLQGVGLVAVVVVTYAFRRWVDRRTFTSLGFERPRAWRAELLFGFGLGVMLMALILLVELGLGAYRFVGLGWQEIDPVALLTGLVVMFLVFVFVAFEEEVVARGYLLQNLASAWGIPTAVVLSSALFSVAHLGNPGASPISSLGIFVAGLQLAIGYLATSRLWLPIGLHLSWNFFQGPVFGFPVSGLDTVRLIRLEPIGPELLTGGEFGPEASLVGLAVDLLGIALILLWARRRTVAPSWPPAAVGTAG